LQEITQDMRGFLIADDMASVVVLLGADEADFNHWQQHRLQQQQQQDEEAAARAASQLLSSSGDTTDYKAAAQGCDAAAGPPAAAHQQQQQLFSRITAHISKPTAGAAAQDPAELRHSSSAASLDMRRNIKRKGGGLVVAQQRQLSPQEVRLYSNVCELEGDTACTHSCRCSAQKSVLLRAGKRMLTQGRQSAA
jgi:hypothetical protein